MSVSVHRAHLPREERRNQILDCALAVFASKGFHETSIADICARARIARGTLYQYFADKRDVLAALVDRIVRRVIDASQHWPPLELSADLVWTEEDNVAFVETRCRQIMEVVFADADTASLILRVAHGTGFVGKALAQIDQHVVGVIAADVRAQIDRGVLRPLDSQIVAEFIVGGIEKIVIRALDDGRAIDVGRIAREIGVLVSSGLLPGDHGPPPPSRATGGPTGKGRATPSEPPIGP
jgi:TetR/AcrR family fatty acid metabolism transcriptional regulator